MAIQIDVSSFWKDEGENQGEEEQDEEKGMGEIIILKIGGSPLWGHKSQRWLSD